MRKDKGVKREIMKVKDRCMKVKNWIWLEIIWVEKMEIKLKVRKE